MKLKEIKGANFKAEIRRIKDYVERDTDHTPSYYCRNLGLEVKEWTLFLKCQWKPSLQKACLISKWFRKATPPLLLDKRKFLINPYWNHNIDPENFYSKDQINT